MAAILVDFLNCFIFILLPVFSLLCLFVFFFFTKPNDSQVGSDLPPTPPSLPIIGHLHHIPFSPLIHKSFQSISSKYGPFLLLRIFSSPIVLVSSASVAYKIFRADDVKVSSRGTPPLDKSLFFGSSGFIMAPYGDYWKFMKKLIVTKMLGPQALMRLRESRADELERFHASLLDKALKNETVEIAKEAIKLTNSSICKMIMRRSCSEENGEAEIIRGLIAETFALFKKLFVASLFRISLFKKEMMSVTRRFDELLERILAEHEEKPDYHHGTDIMNLLLEAYHDENAEYKITRDHIKSLTVELILGGTDSSALTIEWIMAEIINSPNVFERLREEIESVAGKNRTIQEMDLPNLPYLQAVIKEGLRLHPPVPIFTRMLLEECKIGDYHVPKNTSLIVNSYAVMRDPDFWDDPEEFEPERFLASSKPGQDEEREKALKFLPFGSGRRGCPGANLAYTFIGTAIGVMVQCFDWEIKEDKVNMEETLSGMTVSMAHPLSCLPVARTLNHSL